MWISPPQPDSHVWPIKYSHIIFCSFSLSFAYATQTHTQTHTHTCQVIHPRESIQHLVDKALSPATSPGLPFTGPWRFLMDHPRTRMNGASSPLLHLRCHFILSTLLICHSRWPFVTSLELLCTLHMHAWCIWPHKWFPPPTPPQRRHAVSNSDLCYQSIYFKRI